MFCSEKFEWPWVKGQGHTLPWNVKFQLLLNCWNISKFDIIHFKINFMLERFYIRHWCLSHCSKVYHTIWDMFITLSTYVCHVIHEYFHIDDYNLSNWIKVFYTGIFLHRTKMFITLYSKVHETIREIFIVLSTFVFYNIQDYLHLDH